MEKMTHLAIASVPVQKWKEVFDEEQAFRNGTIFPELHRPFYATVLDEKSLTAEQNLNSEDSMLRLIQKAGFVLDDLRLYLDTHPEDKEALELFKTTLKRKRTLMKEFALQFYPLAEVCMDVIEYSCLPEGKIPWEGVCS